MHQWPRTLAKPETTVTLMIDHASVRIAQSYAVALVPSNAYLDIPVFVILLHQERALSVNI